MSPAPAPQARRLLREGLLYGLVGGLQLFADWLCFVALTSIGLAVVPANILGRVVGASLGFWLNGRFTFAKAGERAPLGRSQLLKFTLGWLINAVLSTLAVWALADARGLMAAWMGKLLIDGALAALGFAMSKYWIFR